MWQECAMQTFFQGSNVKYFEVKVRTQETVELDVLLRNMLNLADKRDEEHEFNLNHVKKTNIVTKTPWLLRTRWEKKFEGRNMAILTKLTEKPEKSEGQICRLWSGGSRVIQRCWTGVENIADRGWDLILFWLNSSNPEKADSTPFNLAKKDKTIEKYLNLLNIFD
jgi:hypothetical protein